MKHLEIEKQIIEQLHDLPLEATREVLNFVQYLVQKSSRSNAESRPLGLLKGKASCHFRDDFEMTDEELLGS